MSSVNTVRRMMTNFSEGWKKDHDQVRACWELEDQAQILIGLFRMMTDLEARLQNRAIRGAIASDGGFIGEMDELYGVWIAVAEDRLAAIRDLVTEEYAVDGSEELARIVEECKAMMANNAMEPDMLPFEEMVPLVRPDCPDPGRYGDSDRGR